MLSLALETSSLRGGVAILRGSSCLEESIFKEGLQQGRELIQRVSDLLRRVGQEPGDLGAIAVSKGPGSYTGIRVGVTAAKTLLLGNRCDRDGRPPVAIAKQSLPRIG